MRAHGTIAATVEVATITGILQRAWQDGQSVVCVTDDVRVAAAVSSHVAAVMPSAASLRVLSSSESVFAHNLGDCLVVVGADAVDVSALQADVVVAVHAQPDSEQPRLLASTSHWQSQGEPAVIGRAALELDSPEATVWAQDASPTRVHSGARLIAVVSSSGARGATTCAWAIALAQDTFTVLVDGDSRSAGLDLWIRAEAQAGSRWPDVLPLREVVARSQVARGLISVTDHCLLLSHDRRPIRPEWNSLSYVLSGLAGDDVMVVDLSADSASDFAAAVLDTADDIVVVTEPTVSSCAAAAKFLMNLSSSRERVVLAVRGPRAELSEQAMVAAIACRSTVSVPEDRQFARSLAHGRTDRAVGKRWRAALADGQLLAAQRAGDGKGPRSRLLAR